MLADADENLGESEIREANLAKAEHLCMIGDKDGAVAAFKETYEKTVSLGHRLDIVFTQIRLGTWHPCAPEEWGGARVACAANQALFGAHCMCSAAAIPCLGLPARRRASR